MNTTEGLAPLCRVLRISPCRVAIGLRFTENVKQVLYLEWTSTGGGLCVRLQQNDRQFIAFFCVLTHCVKMNYYFFNYEYFFKCAYK